MSGEHDVEHDEHRHDDGSRAYAHDIMHGSARSTDA